jgi:hypothetical protein
MPPPLPVRYKLEIRLGRDNDIEEWLANDEHLDRPVLIRLLGPDASAKRLAEFLGTVHAAAAVRHPHLEPIFEAEEVAGGAYAVSEWSGGLTLQSRLAGGETLDPAEFTANAAGLAGALAAIHRAGLVHGAIDPGSILYTVSRPARLGGFGRPRRYLTTPAGDVSDLAAVLEQALTGYAPGGPPPSEVVDGLPRAVDEALARAREGELSAHELSVALEALPRPTPPDPDEPRRWRRAPLLAVVLIVVAAGLIALGRVLAGDTGVPVIPGPSATAPTVTTTAPISTTVTSAAGASAPFQVLGATTFDPFGEGGENDDDIGAVIDGDVNSTWRTERYRDPVELLKPGVGLTVEVAGSPAAVELHGLATGATFLLAWSADRPEDPTSWEQLASGRAEGVPVQLQVPVREGGHWLLWFTSLPQQSDGDYWTTVSEIRFRQ